MMTAIFFYWGIIYGVVSIEIFLIQNLDEADWRMERKESAILFGYCGANSVVICHLCRMDTAYALLLSVLAGCLIFACVTDCKVCVVFQFTWWIAGIVGGVLLYRSFTTDYMALELADLQREPCLLPLFFYILLQEVIFCRAYGRADCHAFAVCAVIENAFGMNLLGCLLHMLLAFGGLAIIQAFRHNINRKGNLKQPVAFLPYITISFWLLLYVARGHK